MKRHKHRLSPLFVMAFIVLLSLSGCNSNEGPAESAGKKIDQSVEKAGESAAKIGKKVEDAVHSSVEKAKEAAEATGETVAAGVDSAKKAAATAGEKVEGQVEKAGENVEETVNKFKEMLKPAE